MIIKNKDNNFLGFNIDATPDVWVAPQAEKFEDLIINSDSIQNKNGLYLGFKKDNTPSVWCSKRLGGYEKLTIENGSIRNKDGHYLGFKLDEKNKCWVSERKGSYEIFDILSSTNFSIATSVTEAELNSLTKSIYSIFGSDFFTGKLEVNDPVKLKLSYESKAPFQIDLQPSCLALDYQQENKDIPSVNFNIIAPSITLSLKIFGEEEQKINTSFNFLASASYLDNNRDKFFIHALFGKVSLKEPDPILEKIINNDIVPLLLPIINTKLKDGVKLPSLDFMGINFSAPVIKVNNKTLAVYAAIDGAITKAPKMNLSPRKYGVSILFNDDVANTLATEKLKATEKSGSVHEKNDLPAGTGYEFEAQYSVGLKDPAFQLQDHNSTLAHLTAYGSGSAKIRIKLFGIWQGWVEVGFSISAKPNVQASILLNDGRVILDKFFLRDSLNVHIDFLHVPSFINRFISLISDSIATPAAQLIGSLVASLKIPLYHLLEVDKVIKSGDLNINLKITLDKTIIDTIKLDQKYCQLSGFFAAIKNN